MRQFSVSFIALLILLLFSVVTIHPAHSQGLRFSVGSYEASFDNTDNPDGNSFTVGYLHTFLPLRNTVGEIVGEAHLTYGTPETDSADGTALDLRALGAYKFSFGPQDKVFVSPKLGLGYSDQDYDFSAGGSADGSEVSFAYGLSMGYSFMESTAVEIEYLTYGTPDLDPGSFQGDNVTDISLGLVWHF